MSAGLRPITQKAAQRVKTILFSSATYDKKIGTFQTAKRMGLRVVIVGTDLPAWVQEYTDLFIKANTYDTAATLVALRDSGVRFDGVVTFWDRDVELVAAIAAEFGLPGSSIESASAARNKYLMRRILTKFGIPDIKYAEITTFDELCAAASDIGYPLIIKPVSASASKGVFKIEDAGGLPGTWDLIRRHVVVESDAMFGYNKGRFIVEEFMAGPEYSVEALIDTSTVHILGITEKEIDPSFEEVQHTFPACLSQQEIDEIVQLVTEALVASGLSNCGTHTEVKKTPDGFRIVEINGRLAGDFITTDLIPEATGVDVIAATIAISLGQKPDLTPDRRAAGSVRFLIAERPGVLRKAEVDPRVLQDPDVIGIRMDKRAGDVVGLPPSKFHDARLGYVITRGTDSAAAKRLAKQVLEAGVDVAYA